ncbi:hypothetical protein ACWKYK_13520, partial [Enterobacter hormaechei]
GDKRCDGNQQQRQREKLGAFEFGMFFHGLRIEGYGGKVQSCTRPVISLSGMLLQKSNQNIIFFVQILLCLYMLFCIYNQGRVHYAYRV